MALVATCHELDIRPASDSVQHADFKRINDLLAVVEAQVKQQYLSGWQRVLGRHLHRVDDVVAMWNISRARDAAWVNAETLWAIRDDTDEPDQRLPGFARPDDRLRRPSACSSPQTPGGTSARLVRRGG